MGEMVKSFQGCRSCQKVREQRGKKKGSLQLVQEKSDVRDVKTREKRCQVALAFDSTSCSNTSHQSPSTVGLDIHAQ